MEGLRGRDLRGRKMSGSTISRPQLYTFHVLSPLICTTTQSGGVEGSAILRPISQASKLRPLKNQDPLAQFGCELEEDDDSKGPSVVHILVLRALLGRRFLGRRFCLPSLLVRGGLKGSE